MLGLSSIFLFNFFLHVFCNSTKTSANSSVIACIAATLNPEILKNFPGLVRVGKKSPGRQGLVLSLLNVSDNLNTQITSQ